MCWSWSLFKVLDGAMQDTVAVINSRDDAGVNEGVMGRVGQCIF